MGHEWLKRMENTRKPIAFLVFNLTTGMPYVTLDEEEASDISDGNDYIGLYTRRQLLRVSTK